MRKEDKIKKCKDEEQIKQHVHILTKFIVYKNISQIHINRLSVAVGSKELGIFSKLLTKDEIIYIKELIEENNTDSFIKLLKQAHGSKENLDEYNYFDNYDDNHFQKLLLNLKEDYKLMMVKMDGAGIERNKLGIWSINEKVKHSIYTLNKWLILLEIDIMLQEIEYAVKDRKYNYVAELMYYAGKLFERAKIMLFERQVKTGIKVNRHSSDSGKAKGDINRKRKAKFQEHVNKYVETMSYERACYYTAKKCNEEDNNKVSARTIKRLTCNPNSKARLTKK